MTEFIAYPSRWRGALLALAAIGFVVLGVWMVGGFGPPPTSHRYGPMTTYVFGWFSIVFFGACSFGWFRRLFSTSEQLRVDAEGITSTPWSKTPIPWRDIRDVTVWTYKGQRAIVLHLRHPAQHPGKGAAAFLAGVNRKLTGGDLSISLTGTDRSFDEAMSAMKHFRGS